MSTTNITCQHLDGVVCKQASNMAETEITTTEKACLMCLKQATRVNKVTASLALSKLARPLPENKQYLQVLLATFDPYSQGAGTELKKLISWFYFPDDTKCKCNDRINKMNRWGPDKCEENIDTIMRWLKHSAATHSIPFQEAVVRLLIKRAISNARKAV